MKTILGVCAAIACLLTGCGSTSSLQNRQMVDWDSNELWEYRTYSRFAVHEVYRGKIILPLGEYYWRNLKFRNYLEKEYGIEVVDGSSWSGPRFAGYSEVMRAAAEEKIGEGWWMDAVMKFYDIPLPT